MCQLDFLTKPLRHHDSELNYTLCIHFSYVNQYIIACVQLGISSQREKTQEASISDQVQGEARGNKFIYCKWTQKMQNLPWGMKLTKLLKSWDFLAPLSASAVMAL